MPIPISCVCGQSYMAADQMAGQSATCPNCGQPVLIPLSSPQGTVAYPGPAIPTQQVPGQPMPGQPGIVVPGQQPIVSPEQVADAADAADAPKKKTKAEKKAEKKAQKQAEQKKMIIYIASSAGGGVLLMIVIVAVLMMSGGRGKAGLPEGWVRKNFKNIYLSIAIPKGLSASEGYGSVYRVYRPLVQENSNAQYYFTFVEPISRKFTRERKIDQVLSRLAGDQSFPKMKSAPRTDIQVADMEGVEFKQGETTVMRILFWEKGAFVLAAKRATNQNNDNQVFLDSFKRIKGYGQ